MTVIDSSAVIDYLLGEGVVDQVAAVLQESPAPSAPDVMVFEVLAVLRRHALRGAIAEHRAAAALLDFGELPIEWFASMPLRQHAWSLRANLGPADALFVALAALLGEPLLTKDAGLAQAASRFAGVEARHLGAPGA